MFNFFLTKIERRGLQERHIDDTKLDRLIKKQLFNIRYVIANSKMDWPFNRFEAGHIFCIAFHILKSFDSVTSQCYKQTPQ